jgi:putative flippase GtrA
VLRQKKYVIVDIKDNNLKVRFTRLIRYLLVAVAAYVIDMGGYIFLIWGSITPIVANVLVKILAAIFGFYAHRYLTYQIRNNDNIFNHAIKYFGLVLVYTPLSSLALLGMLQLISDPVLAKFMCDILLFVAVYWVTSKFTFLQSTTDHKPV